MPAAILLLVLVLTACTAEGTWDLIAGQQEILTYSDAWAEASLSRRMRLDFARKKFAEDLENFPVLVVLSVSRVDYATMKPGGDDLRFFAAGESPAELYYDVDEFDPSGRSFIWVKVPRIAANSKTGYIWMYWGGDAAATAFRSPAGVWAGYELVYHLGESGTIFADSSGKGRTGIANSAAVPEPGIVGGAFRSKKSPANYINSNWTLTPPVSHSYTVEVWVRGEYAPGTHSRLSNGPIMADRPFRLAWDHFYPDRIGMLRYRDDNSVCADWKGVPFVLSGGLQGGRWYYLAVTASAAVPEIRSYRDGSPVEVDPSYDGTMGDAGYTLRIGSDNTYDPMDGLVDEARVYPAPRSAAWIAAQYASMTDSLIRYGYTQTQ